MRRSRICTEPVIICHQCAWNSLASYLARTYRRWDSWRNMDSVVNLTLQLPSMYIYRPGIRHLRALIFLAPNHAGTYRRWDSYLTRYGQCGQLNPSSAHFGKYLIITHWHHMSVCDIWRGMNSWNGDDMLWGPCCAYFIEYLIITQCCHMNVAAYEITGNSTTGHPS